MSLTASAASSSNPTSRHTPPDYPKDPRHGPLPPPPFAKLVVLAHVDVQKLHFRKIEGRNDNVLTCVSAVFNRNGNFLQGTQKVVTMHWKDETLEHKLASGITLKTSFDVKPGSYLVRLVVRDEQGRSMSAENGSVEIR